MNKEMKKVIRMGDVPQTRHFVVIVYTEETGYDGWDEKEGGGTYKFRTATHYVTEDREVWEAKIKELATPKFSYSQQNADYVAFVVDCLAKVETNIVINIK